MPTRGALSQGLHKHPRPRTVGRLSDQKREVARPAGPPNRDQSALLGRGNCKPATVKPHSMVKVAYINRQKRIRCYGIIPPNCATDTGSNSVFSFIAPYHNGFPNSSERIPHGAVKQTAAVSHAGNQ